MELALHWVGAVAAHVAAHSLAGTGGDCKCACTGCSAAAVLALLKGQLDRCGPERLSSAAKCPCCTPGLGVGVAVAVLLLGVLLGVSLGVQYKQ